MNAHAGRLIILRVVSLLEGRDAQNERDGAASRRELLLPLRSISSVAALAQQQQRSYCAATSQQQQQ